MTNYNLEQSKAFEYQLILSALLICTIIISMILTYNEKIKLDKNKSLFSNGTTKKILITNRSVALCVSLGFLLLNVFDRKTKENDGYDNLKFANLQIDASIFSLIAAIIVLYIAFNDENQPLINLENPGV